MVTDQSAIASQGRDDSVTSDRLDEVVGTLKNRSADHSTDVDVEWVNGGGPD